MREPLVFPTKVIKTDGCPQLVQFCVVSACPASIQLSLVLEIPAQLICVIVKSLDTALVSLPLNLLEGEAPSQSIRVTE